MSLTELKKYIIVNLGISPKMLLCKNKIIKSDYIISALCKEEIFFPNDCELLKLVNGVMNGDTERIITILSIELCATEVYKCDKVKHEFVKAFVGEHFK